MTPDLTITIKANAALETQEAVRQYIEELQCDHDALRHYGGALVDVVNTQEDDIIEIYNLPSDDGVNGTRLLWMPCIGRAALNAYQCGDWLWTDAASPDEALRRYLDDDMRP